MPSPSPCARSADSAPRTRRPALRPERAPLALGAGDSGGSVRVFLPRCLENARPALKLLALVFVLMVNLGL